MDKQTEQTLYHSIVLAAVAKARAIGEAAPGTDAAVAAYQVLEAILGEAEVWGVSRADLDLDGFDTQSLLIASRRAA